MGSIDPVFVFKRHFGKRDADQILASIIHHRIIWGRLKDEKFAEELIRAFPNQHSFWTAAHICLYAASLDVQDFIDTKLIREKVIAKINPQAEPANERLQTDVALEDIASIAARLLVEKQDQKHWDEVLEAIHFDAIYQSRNLNTWGTIFSLLYELVEDKRQFILDLGESSRDSIQDILAFILIANPNLTQNDGADICKWTSEISLSKFTKILEKMAAYENQQTTQKLADAYLDVNPLEEETQSSQAKNISPDALPGNIALYQNYAILSRFSANRQLSEQYSKRAYELGEQLNHNLEVLKHQLSSRPASDKVSADELSTSIGYFSASEKSGLQEGPIGKILHAVEIKESDRETARKIGKQIFLDIHTSSNLQQIIPSNRFGLVFQPEQIVELLVDLGLINEAARAAERLIDYQPSNFALIRASANLCHQYGDHRKAVEYYSRLEVFQGLTREEKCCLAESLEILGMWQDALAVHKEINAVSLNDYQKKAICAYRVGDPDYFKDILNSAQEFYSIDGLFQVLEALFDQENGKQDTAETTIEAIIASRKRDQSTIQFILEFYLKTSQLDQAQALINSLSSLERGLPLVSLKRYEVSRQLLDMEECRRILEANSLHKNLESLSVVETIMGWCFEMEEPEYARSLLKTYSDRWAMSPQIKDFKARLAIADGQFAAAKEIMNDLIQREDLKEEWAVDYGLALIQSTRVDLPFNKSGIVNQVYDLTAVERELFDHYSGNLLLKVIRAELSGINRLDRYKSILADKDHRHDPDIWRVHAGMGMYYFQQGQYDLAIVNFREARKAQPQKKAIEMHLIKALSKMRLYDDAISIFTSRKVDECLDLSDLLEINTSLKNSEQWMHILEEMIVKLPQDKAARIVLAQLYTELGKKEQSLKTIQELDLSGSGQTNERLICTQILIHDGFADEAKRMLENLLTSEKDISDGEYLNGAFLYNQMDELHKAANLLNLIHQPGYSILAFKTGIYLKLGLTQEAGASVQTAIEAYENRHFDPAPDHNQWIEEPDSWQMINSDPIWIYVQSIEIKAASHDLHGALSDAQRCMARFPDDLRIKTIALNLTNILGDENAIDSLMENLPENLMANQVDADCCVWGEVALRKGHEIFAANLISQCLEILPDDKRVKTLQARLLTRNGNIQDGQTLFNEIMAQADKQGNSLIQSLEGYQFWLAEAALDLGQYPAAMKICEGIFEQTGITPKTAQIFLQGMQKIVRANWMNDRLQITTHAQNLNEDDEKFFNDICVMSETAIKENESIQRLIANIQLWLDLSKGDVHIASDMTLKGLDDLSRVVSSYYLEGRSKAEIALAENARDDQARFLMAILEMESHPEKSVEYIAEVMRKSADRPEYYAALALGKQNLGQWDDAYAAVNLALSIWPDEYKWQILAGELSKKLGDMRASLEHFNKAAEIHQDENIQSHLGELNLKAGNQSGIAYLESKLTGEDRDFETLIQLGELSLRNCKYQKAAKYLENARRYKPLEPQSYVLMSKVALKVGNAQKAAEIIDQALQLNPNDVKVIQQKASVIDSLGDARSALEFIEQYDQSLIGIRPEFIIQKSTYLAELEGSEKALVYLLSKKETVHSPELMAEIAREYLKLGNLSEAEASAEQALQANPENPYTLELLAQIFTQSGDLDKAIDFLVKTIQINAFVPEFYIEMARIYQSRRDLRQAEDVLKSGLRSNPQNFELLSSLGLLYYQQGLYRKSEEQLRQASSINPYNENTKRLLSTLMNANIIQGNMEANTIMQEV